MAAGFTPGNNDGPKPWWQEPNTDVGNLDRSAPSGYTYDRVKMGYVPTVGSATDLISQRKRKEGVQDIGNMQEQQAFDAQKGLVGRMSSALTGMSVGGGNGNAVGGGGSALPAAVSAPSWQSIAGPSQAVQDNQESATFGKVKDKAANTAAAAMQGLSGELQSRGLSGGGYEAGAIGGTLARESNQIGEGVRQWAGQQYDDANHRADVNTNAGMAARGQDLGAGVQQRGQDMQANDANQKNALATQQIANQKQQALMSLMQNAVGGMTMAVPKLSY